jgi:hypothetical protein
MYKNNLNVHDIIKVKQNEKIHFHGTIVGLFPLYDQIHIEVFKTTDEKIPNGKLVVLSFQSDFEKG